MRPFGMSLALVALAAFPAMGAPGDQWILGIRDIDSFDANNPSNGPIYRYIGAGYSGPQSSGDPQYVGNAYGRQGKHAAARLFWELSGNAINSGRSVPSSMELYTIEYFGASDPGRADWLPVESMVRGNRMYDVHGIDPLIPWAGQFSTNHQWIGSSGSHDRQWHLMNNDGDGGPQAPDSANFNAFGDGIYMWLKAGSWLYVKWDFNFPPDNPMGRAFSALRLTQITGTVPPDLEGDYNEDGTVDAADYVVWRKTNVDGSAGYQTWVENFGMSVGAGGGSAAVPEPASMALLIGCLAGMAWLASRSRG